MASPAPPPPDVEELPLVLKEFLKPLYDYVLATHIEDIKIEVIDSTDPNAQHEVELERADSGTIAHIKIKGTTC